MAGFYRLLGDPIHQATAFGGGVLTKKIARTACWEAIFYKNILNLDNYWQNHGASFGLLVKVLADFIADFVFDKIIKSR